MRGEQQAIKVSSEHTNNQGYNLTDGKMANIALGAVEKIVKVGMMIKKAVETVRQNEVECQEIEELVDTLMAILLLLQNTAVMNHPAMNGALVGLEKTLNHALKLVTVCQGRNVACLILGSGDMSRKLRRIKEDILQKTVLGTFATAVQVTMTLTNTIRYGGAHRLLTQTQDAGEVDISYSGHLTTEDSRSGVNNVITMAAIGSEMHCAPSSRLTEFNLSEYEAITHHFPGTNIIRGGGHSLLLRQEILIIVQITCDKSRSQAMKLLSAMGGVESVKLGGDGTDQVLVVGYGLDSIKLTTTLRKKVGKKVGTAELLLVGDADAATAAATAVASARANKRHRDLYIPPALVVDYWSGPQASIGPVHEPVRMMPRNDIVFGLAFLFLLFLRTVGF